MRKNQLFLINTLKSLVRIGPHDRRWVFQNYFAFINCTLLVTNDSLSFYYFMCMVFCFSVCLCTMSLLVPMKARKMQSYLLELKVTSDCELPCGCWGSNPGPLEKQLVFLTSAPSLQPQLLVGMQGWIWVGWQRNEEKTSTQTVVAWAFCWRSFSTLEAQCLCYIELNRDGFIADREAWFLHLDKQGCNIYSILPA